MPGNLLTGRVVSQEYDEAYGDIVVIENSDMVIISRQKIATRLKDPKDQKIKWIIKELCYNSDEDIVLIKTKEPELSKPSWVPYDSSEMGVWE